MNRRFLLPGIVLGAMVVLVASSSEAMPIRPDLLDPHQPSVTTAGVPVVLPPPWVDRPLSIPAGGRRGTNHLLIICIQFPDQGQTQTAASFGTMVFGPWTPHSMNDYYQEISYGNLSLTGATVGWYTAAQNRAYYGAGQTGFGSYPNNAGALAAEAIAAANLGGVDFSQYDNDADGVAESIFIVHSGQGYETSLNTNDVRSHLSSMSSMGDPSAPYTYDGKLVDTYLCGPELQTGAPVTHVKIGVYCHEYGHMLGLPDLYDVGTTCTGIASHGIGVYDLMAMGGWGGDILTPERPTHMSAWSKIQLGWVTPTVVSSPVTGQTLPPVETNATVLKVGMDTLPMEYFLLSYRDNTLGFDQDLPGAGLMIWHIDESITTDNDCEDGGGCSSGSHYLVALEQPDGNFNLDCGTLYNYGDAGDVYPYGGVTSFTGATNPSSDTYSGGSSGTSITSIAVGAGVVTMDIAPGSLWQYLAYDDGSCELGYSWGVPGYGFALRVTPTAYPFALKGIHVFSHDLYSPNFQCQIWNSAGAGGTPGSALSPVHTTSGAMGLSFNYEDFTPDSIVIASGDLWLLYIEYATSKIGSDTSPPWNGRTMTYYYGSFHADNGAYGNYMMRAVGDVAPTTAVDGELAAGAAGPRLSVGRPNPFSGRTLLHLSGVQPGHVWADVYDAQGRQVRRLLDEVLAASDREIPWDGRDDQGRQLPSGVYLCRLRTAGEEVTRKIVLTR